MAGGVVLGLLFQRGFHGLVPVLLVPVSTLLWRLRNDPAQGLELGWSGSGWFLGRGGEKREVEPGRRTVVTPWIIYLDLVLLPGGRRKPLWVYADSVDARGLRCLRVRLSLAAHDSN